ncbi:MAG: hypothetical protein QM774_07210 [Gordonia sp. (in: high G+C Gram-positive bacteria)]|uniref:hypothetical protein n=1 Tax=Gordonia sp. (in: high G+C Gram-positive bacteria) TaxID=84139 RepID=UPI0039E30E50
MGYRPVTVDGRPQNPHGSCSSPVPLPARFEPACRSHDFGYDLLRYSAATTGTVPPGARAALDRRLVSDMRATCRSADCYAAADLARVALAVNTWRQRDGAPDRETPAHIVVSLAGEAARTVAGLR